MAHIKIYNKETKEELKIVSTSLQAYMFRYKLLSNDGIDTYTEKVRKNNKGEYVKKKNKPKTENEILDEKCSKLWREILYYDSDYKCEHCGKSRYIIQLNAHHIITRGNKHLRWKLYNGITLCIGCHNFNSKFSAHKTPDKFKKWLDKYNNEGFYQELVYESNLYKKNDLKEDYKYLKKEAKKRGL